MNIEATKVAATQLLNEFYQLPTAELPSKRIKTLWENENKRGFFLGIIQHGLESHLINLFELLTENQLDEQQQFSTKVQLANPKHTRTFIDDMFTFYILPFHQDYSDYSTCSSSASTPPQTRRNSADDSAEIPEGRGLTHEDFKNTPKETGLTQQNFKDKLLKRDTVCLFCWESLQLEGAHIISQKNIPMAFEETSILERARLSHKNEVQNGLLLCKVCHGEFDQLRRYVDVIDDKLVIKVVNNSTMPNDVAYRDWKRYIRDLKTVRTVREEDWADLDKRKAVETNGEMALYFVENDLAQFPNREALRFHMTACLIWRMAGGAESEEEDCYDDDDGFIPVDYRSKRIDKWLESSATLIIDNSQ